MTYLGYVVFRQGITADPSKVTAVQDFPTPKSIKELRSFLGLAFYYRHFIPGFSKVASSLFSSTHKGTDFVWNAECRNVFNCLKSLLTSVPLLVFPNFEKGFILETDAFGVGLGAVLAQEQDNVA